MPQAVIFHLAIPIYDISQAKKFYSRDLGCKIGRENKSAIIFNFYGTQLVGHMTHQTLSRPSSIYPSHLGLILPSYEEWQRIYDLAQVKDLNFYQKPKLRFSGKILEHHCFFLEDPFHNLLEFKYYRHQTAIFGRQGLDWIGDTEK